MSPKAVSSLLIHTLPPETVASAAVIFGGELSPTVDVSDQESSRPIITTPSVPVLAPIITTSYIEEDTNEAPCSPLSDTGSSSGGDSSGPETPSELKRELPFSAALELSSKEAPSLQLTVYLPPEGDPAIDEDVEFVDDFVIVGHHAPDPPSPIINTVPSEWTTSKLPGSFEEFTTSTGDRTSPEHKSTSTITVADVPPLTADMIQLCHALLAVSNCAGLVAQFVVGFSSLFWSL
ncbi:hypothetical protein OPQ81_003563 [Rhizoctonia solani]|nr:hypothetical protein OPQ81_003563 [Rhizoctonia solani]